jgi:hypothetical protein
VRCSRGVRTSETLHRRTRVGDGGGGGGSAAGIEWSWQHQANGSSVFEKFDDTGRLRVHSEWENKPVGRDYRKEEEAAAAAAATRTPVPAPACLRLPACACLRLPAPGACRVCLRLPAPACAWRLPCLRACFKFDSSSHTHHHVACALRVCLLMVYVLYTPLVLVLVLCIMRRPDQEQPTWVPFHRPVSGRQRMHLQCERWYRGCECLQGRGTRDERQGQLLAQPAQWHYY